MDNYSTTSSTTTTTLWPLEEEVAIVRNKKDKPKAKEVIKEAKELLKEIDELDLASEDEERLKVWLG